MTTQSGRTTALQVKKAATDDLESHTYVCNSSDFMDNFFGKPAIDLDPVFERLKDKGVYELEEQDSTGNAGCWKQFPGPPKSKQTNRETAYYGPLETTCNAIIEDDGIKAYKAAHLNEGPFVEGFWFDRSAHVPKSLDPGAPAIRADLIFFLSLMQAAGSRENTEIVENIKEIEKKRRQSEKATNGDEASKTTNKRNKPEGTETAETVKWTPEELQTIFLSWLRSIAVLEVKPFEADGQEAKDTIIQLATYLRQILREQHDRRFVFGMILFHDKLSLWYCDRSGLLGTYDPIDIHKSPKDFIRVISSLALMTPWKLGWDKTMKIVPKIGSSRPYYYHSPPPGITAKHLPTKQDDLRWEITIKESVFRTIQSLSTARSEIMCGRATMVWLAACVNDQIPAEEAAPVVIKHSWRPCSEGSHCEHEFFDRVYGKDSKDMVLLSHDEPGSNTVKDLRGDIPCVAINSRETDTLIEKQRQKKNKPSKSEKQNTESSDNRVYHKLPNLFEDMAWSQPIHETTPRCQYRMVLSIFGWPLKAFKDLAELLEVFKCAIEEYERMYNNGVCHRDISIGNIVIDYLTGKGHLFDLDYSKMLEELIQQITIGDIKNDMTAEELELLKKKITAWKVHSQFANLDEVFATALNHSYPTDGGFTAVRTNILAGNLELMGLVEQHQDDAVESMEEKVMITPENTGVMIDKDTILPPTFMDHHPTHTFRTGTKAFMSHQQLGNDPPPHKAVHDMESVFWVALHICITREGSGGQRREEFSSSVAAKLEDLKDPEKKNQFWNLIRVTNLLFETSREEIAAVKRDMFKHPEYFKEYVLPLIHPYFEPLAPLLLSWWRILTLAFSINSKTGHYERRDLYCDFIIAPFKAAVVDAINQLPAKTTPTSKEQEVEDYREKRRREIKEEIIRLKALYPQHSTSEPAIIQENQPTTFSSQIDPSSRRSTTPENHPLYSSTAYQISPPRPNDFFQNEITGTQLSNTGLPTVLEAPSSKKAKRHHD